MRLFIIVIACSLVSSSTVARAAPATTTTAPTAPSARRGSADASARHPAIQAAIAELTKEIESALRSGQDAPRENSDYFSPVTAAEIPPAAVIAALRRPIGSDPRVQAYVKWHLLSALPAQLDEKTAADLLQVYRAAPPPLPRLGLDKQQRDELDRMVRKSRQDDEERISGQVEQMEARLARDNAPILKYRDGLFAKLPPSYDALAAGFEDAVARMNAGADPAEHTRNVCAALEVWATTAQPEQMRMMARAIGQLEKKKGPEYYTKVYWSEGSDRLQWSKSQASFSGIAQLEQAQKTLEEKIRNPTVPLKMKEER